MVIDRKLVRENVLLGKELGFYSRVIVYEDLVSSTIRFHYVDKGIDINSEIARLLILGHGSYRIAEVYSYSSDLNEQLEKYSSGVSSLEQKALKFATKMHEGQTRFDGTPYIEHPKNVARYTKKYKASSKHLDVLVASALLHDTLEDTCLNFYDLVEFFGPQVASIVVELTTDEELKREVGKTRYLEIKLTHMSSWALTIKLCDRLDNIQDLRFCKKAFRDKYVAETLQIIHYLLLNRGFRFSRTHKAIIGDILRHIHTLYDLLLPGDIKELSKVREMFKVID